MKRVICGCVGLLALASTLAAQSSRALTAEIPFPFYVGDKQMPAGEYCFGPYDNHRALEVRNVGRTSPFDSAVVLISDYGAVPKNEGKERLVVFNKYGDGRIFLTQIIPAGLAVTTVKGKKERESVSSTLHASNYPTTVTIVAMR